MEGSLVLNILVGLGMGCLTLTLYVLGRVFNSIWWRPKRLETLLREQGINGTSYKLLYGDLNHINHLLKEAWSKPMPLSHQIAPRVSPFFYQMIQKYGKISLSWNETMPRLTIADPELMREILMDKNGHYQKHPANPFVQLLSMGLATLEREKWAKRRKLMNPAFHHEKIHGMMPTFMQSCENLIKQWNEKLVGSSQESGSLEMDIASEFQDFSADVISRAAFGSTLEEGKRIFELQKEQVVLAMESTRTVYIPGLRFVPTKKNRRRYEIDDEIKANIRTMIEKKEVDMQNGESKGGDLLGLLLQCRMNTKNELTIEDLLEECKLFYFAGQETTANLLTWTFIVLAMHPNWQEMAREEVLQKCGKEKPELDTIIHLKIVSMVLNEVLRLYPPVIGIFRNTYKTTKLGAMTIPSGVGLFLPMLFLHHDAEYWGDDVGEFKPERFAEGVSKATKDDHIAFYPFAWGHRICIGQNFAMLEAKLALSMVLQNFWFELSPSYTHAPYTIITLQPQHGAPIILHQL